MATRLEEIIVRIRDTLSDPNSERWTDAQLIRLIDEGQKTVAKHAGFIRSKITVPIVAGVADYTLPEQVYAITRVMSELTAKLPLVSHDEADFHYGATWELTEGATLLAVIYDKLQANNIKLYPIPTQVTAGSDVPVVPVYGVTSSGAVTVDSLSSPFGVATGFTVSSSSVLSIYCLLNATTLVDINSDLECSIAFDKALKFYATGMALRDDKDVQNRTMGNEELGFFQIELREAMSDSAKDFTGTTTQYTPKYQGAFD
jgi:uncharacterized protein DUF6682